MAVSRRCGTIASVVVVVVAIVVGVGVYFIVRNNNDKSSTRGSRAVDSLKFLVLVTRHGNRCPLYPLPNSPYPCDNATYWPYTDDLSITGRKQLYNLGLKIRSLYNGFLDSKFFNKDMYVSSTFVPRVVKSAECLMAGLYPPSGDQIWNKKLLWQPVPVHIDSLDKTELKNICERFVTLESEQKEEFRVRWAENITYFNNYTSTYLNTTVTSSFGVLQVWDAFMSNFVEGFTLPAWTASIFPEAMYPMMNDMYVKYVSANDEMTRFTVGPLFVQMMEAMNSKVDGSLYPDRSLYFWSGHDDTLIGLQAVVGLPIEDIVGVVTPSSAMLFELHQDSTNNKHFIQVLYIDGLDHSLKPKLLEISFCNNHTACDYEVFVNGTAKFTNLTGANYDEVCNNTY